MRPCVIENNCYLQRASCFATESGLKVAVEAGKCSQANAFIQTEIFQVKFNNLCLIFCYILLQYYSLARQ